jgi:transcriptional regulator with XRE-family HTH domain
LTEESGCTPGDIFRDMREKAGLSATQLAAKIGCAKSHIYRVEKNEADPSLQFCKKWITVTKPSLYLIIKLLIPREFLYSASKAWRQRRRDENASDK